MSVCHPFNHTNLLLSMGTHLPSCSRDKEAAICAFLVIEGAFLVIEGAFDNTSHDAVKDALERIGTNCTIGRWIQSLLRPRQATFTLVECTVTVIGAYVYKWLPFCED